MAANSASQEGTSTDTDKRIAIARSAGPIFVSKEATIVDVDGNILIRGSNGWTCSPRTQRTLRILIVLMKCGRL